MRYFLVEIQDYMTVTRQADPDDRWDGDDLQHDITIEGLTEVKDGDYHHVCIDDGPVDELYLVYVVYGTGDSFHREEGCVSFVTLHRDRDIAEENAKRIRAHNDGTDANSSSNGSYTVELLMDNGKKIKQHCPWAGYFESLESVIVERVDVDRRKRF